MRKSVCKSYKNRKERFFETHAFAVCVNRPLTYVIYADGGGFLAPAVFRQPHSVSKNKFFDTLKYPSAKRVDIYCVFAAL